MEINTVASLPDDAIIPFRIVHHAATYTSEASAKARGEELSVGGKAIVMKVDERFRLFVLSAALKIDSQKLKNHFKARKVRFATTCALLARHSSNSPGSDLPEDQCDLILNNFLATIFRFYHAQSI